MCSRGSDKLRLTVDIVAGAGLSLSETDNGLRVREYRTWPQGAEEEDLAIG